MPTAPVKRTSTARHSTVVALSVQVDEIDKDVQAIALNVAKMADQITNLASSTQILSNNDASLSARFSDFEKRLQDYEQQRLTLNMANKDEHGRLHEQILTLQNTMMQQLTAALSQQQTAQTGSSEKTIDRLVSVGMVVLGIILTYLFTHR